MIRMRAIYGTLLMLIVSAASTVVAEETAETLAERAAQEFDALAQPLSQAAREMTAQLDILNQKRRDKAIITAHDMRPTNPQYYVSTKGKYEGELAWMNSEREHRVEVQLRDYGYEFKGIDRIARTGRRELPFEATVRFEVTLSMRRAETVVIEPIERTDFRRATVAEQEGEEAISFLDIGVPEESSSTGGPAAVAPLPVAPKQADPGAWLPKAVLASMDELQKSCRQAKPEKSTDLRTAVARYSLDEKKWVFQNTYHRAEGTVPARNNGQSDELDVENPFEVGPSLE